MALRIENNAELFGVEAALTKAMSRRWPGDYFRSSSPRKREASPLQDDYDWNNNYNRQKLGDYRQKPKGKSWARFEERIQPALPPVTPATPTDAGSPAAPWQYSARQTTTSPYPALPKQADGSVDWQKVQCYTYGQTGHTKKFCPSRGGGLGLAGRSQPGSTPTPGRSGNNSAQQG